MMLLCDAFCVVTSCNNCKPLTSALVFYDCDISSIFPNLIIILWLSAVSSQHFFFFFFFFFFFLFSVLFSSSEPTEWIYMVKKKHLKIYFSRTTKASRLNLGIQHRDLKVYQTDSNNDSRLTFDFSKARSNLHSNTLVWGKYCKNHFLKMY